MDLERDEIAHKMSKKIAQLTKVIFALNSTEPEQPPAAAIPLPRHFSMHTVNAFDDEHQTGGLTLQSVVYSSPTFKHKYQHGDLAVMKNPLDNFIHLDLQRILSFFL